MTRTSDAAVARIARIARIARELTLRLLADTIFDTIVNGCRT
jgi:hypothetical protein